MPTVGEKSFDYSDEGMAAAQEEAQSSGQEMQLADTPASYMEDMDTRLEEATDLLGRAEQEEMPENEEEFPEPDESESVNMEVVESIFQYMNNRAPDMSDPKDITEVQLILDSITPEMIEDLQNQEISIVDAVLQVHRSRSLTKASPEPVEEEAPTYFS
jgi:hypothetical protein|tara:strand:- start:634 stop:1110 length:477 start_codon:yes stop_codon:yes gene_type:complete